MVNIQIKISVSILLIMRHITCEYIRFNNKQYNMAGYNWELRAGNMPMIAHNHKIRIYINYILTTRHDRAA